MRVLLAVIGAATVIMLVWIAGAYPHDAAAMSDPKRGAWFESLKQPGSATSCCNLTDCDQTQARQLADGSWEAVLHDYKGYRWIKVPPEKVLKHPLSIDGEAYLCNSTGGAGGTDYSPGVGAYQSSPWEATIYCFVPPIPGY